MGELSQVAPEWLDMRSLFALGRPLKDVERQRYSQECKLLRGENASLRVLKNAKLVSAEPSHFDSVILAQTQSRWLKVARVIGYAMVESSDSTVMQVGDLYLGGRVAALVDAGMLEAQGNLRNWRHSEVRLPGNGDAANLVEA